MKMKKRYKVIFLGAIIAVLCSALFYSFSAIGEKLYYDFEDRNFEWNPLYGNADWEFITEDDGNTYLKLTYNGNKGREREYYDVDTGAGIYDYETIQVNYDIMYPEFTEERNGEMQIKWRCGPGSSETKMTARVAQVNGFLQAQGGDGIGYQRIRDINGQYFQMEEKHWYTIKMTVDLVNHNQTTYVFDRDTESLLAVHQDIATVDNTEKPNTVAFSSKTSMCLDNVSIFEYSCQDSYIYGTPYVKKGIKTRYYLLGKGVDESAAALPKGSTVWSIVNPRKGVSINSNSGSLNTSTTTESGMVIIKAEHTVGDVIYESKFAVNITN